MCQHTQDCLNYLLNFFIREPLLFSQHLLADESFFNVGMPKWSAKFQKREFKRELFRKVYVQNQFSSLKWTGSRTSENNLPMIYALLLFCFHSSILNTDYCSFMLLTKTSYFSSLFMTQFNNISDINSCSNYNKDSQQQDSSASISNQTQVSGANVSYIIAIKIALYKQKLIQMLKKTPITKMIRQSASTKAFKSPVRASKVTSDGDQADDTLPQIYLEKFDDLDRRIKEESMKRQFDYNQLYQMIMLMRTECNAKRRESALTQKIEKVVGMKEKMSSALNSIVNKGIKSTWKKNDGFGLSEEYFSSPLQNKSLVQFLKPSKNKTINSQKQPVALQSQVKQINKQINQMKSQVSFSNTSIQGQFNQLHEKLLALNFDADIQKQIRKGIDEVEFKVNQSIQSIKMEITNSTLTYLEEAKLKLENSIEDILNAKKLQEFQHYEQFKEAHTKQTKQLNSFLMTQMLNIYQKLKDLESELAFTKQQIQTRTTISNGSIMVDDKPPRSQNQRNSPKEEEHEVAELNFTLQRLQSHQQQSEDHLSEIDNKVIQNQKMIYELITISKMLSLKISTIIQSNKNKKQTNDSQFEPIPEQNEDTS